MSIKVFQLQKRDSEFVDIQDRFSINLQNKSIALADGTTQSFNSKIWAELITQGFTNNPILNSIELIEQFKKDSCSFKEVKPVFHENPAIAALQIEKVKKGGTATFLGLQFFDKNNFEIVCSGDTNLFKLTNNLILNTFPFSTREALDKNDYFLNSEELLNNKVNEDFFVRARFQLNVNETIILATDALSRFFLEFPDQINDFLKISSFEDFHNFCLRNWDDKKLQEDDISAIIIQDELKDCFELFCPIVNDVDIEDCIDVEIDSDEKDDNFKSIENAKNMLELKKELGEIKTQIQQLKERQKRSEILQYGIISMLFIFLAFSYLKFGRVNNAKIISKEILKKDAIIKNLKLQIKENKEEKKSDKIDR